MNKISMSDIPVRTKAGANFILMNENVKMELEPTSYSITVGETYCHISLTFYNLDIREIFKPYVDQKFVIQEISESGTFFYQNMTAGDPNFYTQVSKDGNIPYIESILSFTKHFH